MSRYSRQRSRSPYGGRDRRPVRRRTPSYSRSPSYRGGGRNKRYNSRSPPRRSDRRDNYGGGYGGQNRGYRNDRRQGGRYRSRSRSPQYGGRRDNRRRDDRGRRGGFGNQDDEEIDDFRHPEMSRSPPHEEDRKQWHCDKIALEEKQVAYVFGRMGSTKDKLARVSGARIDLVGQELVLQGKKLAVERAKGYVRILLEQRHGDTTVVVKEHQDDLVLVKVPTSCKGFITGKRGATLRQIEREHATLMTFCKRSSDDSEEPLAIFGSVRGRLGAQLKVMSIVEGKVQGYYETSRNDDCPLVATLGDDGLEDDDVDWGVEFKKIPKEYIGFVLGRKGATRLKLQVASGCIIQYIGRWAAFGGTKADRERGRQYIEWLLASRDDNDNWSRVDVSGRKDYDIIWVPESSVGYVTGVKANTLRKIESSTGTFCFFEKKNGRKYEKMLIFSHMPEWRKKAIEEVRTIVIIHQRKINDDKRIVADEDYRGSQSNSRNRSKSNSRSNSRNRSKSRSYSRSQSRSPQKTNLQSDKRRSHSRSKSKSQSRSRSGSRSPKREQTSK